MPTAKGLLGGAQTGGKLPGPVASWKEEAMLPIFFSNEHTTVKKLEKLS